MRSSTLVSAFLLISLLFAVAFANDSYWKPTEDDLKVVSYAELEVRFKQSQYIIWPSKSLITDMTRDFNRFLKVVKGHSIHR